MLFLLRKLPENFLHLGISVIAQLVYQMQKKPQTNEGISRHTTAGFLAAAGGSVIPWPTARCSFHQGAFSERNLAVAEVQDAREESEATRRKAEDGRADTKLFELARSELAAAPQ